MLTTTTVALALDMGANLVSILKVLLERRASDSDKRGFEKLIEQHDRFSRECQSIAVLLRQYNETLAQAAKGASITALRQLCTEAGYKHVRTTHEAYGRSQISHLYLEQFELLAVDIKQIVVGQVNAIEQSNQEFHTATAYTREQWLAYYTNGSQLRTDVVNAYQLLWHGGYWKIEGNEIFSKQPAT